MGRKTPVGVTLYTVWESGMEVGEPEYIIYMWFQKLPFKSNSVCYDFELSSISRERFSSSETDNPEMFHFNIFSIFTVIHLNFLPSNVSPQDDHLCLTLMGCHEKWHEHVNVWSFLVIVITKTMPLCKKQSRHNKQKTETLNYLHLHIFKAVWQSNNVIHSRKILLKLQGEKDNNVLETQHFRYQNT